MNNYTELIVLSYFKQYGEKYDVSELMRLAGLTAYQLNNILENMIKEERLFYDDYLLSITEKGMASLVASNLALYNFNDDSYDICDINKEKSIALGFPYVPENFDAKV